MVKMDTTPSKRLENRYKPEKIDIELALKCKEYLNVIFPYGIQDKIQEFSKLGLIKLFEKIIVDAAYVMDVNIEKVDFYNTVEPPHCNWSGYYLDSDKSIHINAYYIYEGTPWEVEWQIYTVFHELKHARQWTAINKRKDYGYSDKLLKLWYDNLCNFITMEENEELYRKQPVEMDSFGFTAMLRGELQFETI